MRRPLQPRGRGLRRSYSKAVLAVVTTDPGPCAAPEPW
ncbi:hypothetical protein GLA29479_2474 [Lysobacter antibioticus]|nr:hypothetical protein GLA29479_2474 [Lysobacter antibioticus]